tara:strand:- start:376 stop:1113 length:738 start_codon:yes stop_codon:yes gene_type:complete
MIKLALKIFQYSSILFLLTIISCSSPEKITISPLLGSPEYENSSIGLNLINESGDYFVSSFYLENYELGIQTENLLASDLANSERGQHVHLIINNGPYTALYDRFFEFGNDEKSHVVLAFLSRSYHESVKNPNAYVLAQIGNLETNIDLENEFLFYSRPKGTYKGKDAEKVLLDFYLVNTEISPNGNKVRATINDTVFLIDDWIPFYIEGLKNGENKIKLELIDSNGNLIDVPFNPSIKTFNIEK